MIGAVLAVLLFEAIVAVQGNATGRWVGVAAGPCWDGTQDGASIGDEAAGRMGAYGTCG